jgi:hypothetical protein
VTSFPSPKASCPTRRIGLHCWLGHDQIRLKILFPVEYAEVGERKPVGRFGYREDVAGLVAPGLEMNRLGRADAEQDAQHFDAGVALRQCRIELLPPCSRAEMKCRGLAIAWMWSGGDRSSSSPAGRISKRAYAGCCRNRVHIK